MARNKTFKRFIRESEAFTIYFNILKNIALSNIEWNNVPPEIDLRYVENTLFMQGRCLFFRENIAEVFAWLQFTPSGQIDIYNNPVGFTVNTASGYYNNSLDSYNSVPVYANMTRTPEIGIIEWYAFRLAEILQKISLNMDVCTSPELVIIPEEMELSVKNAIQQKENGVPVIVAKKGFEQVSYELMGVEAQKNFIAEKLQNMFEEVWNEALTYLGVSNSTINKKERVLVDEIKRAQGGTIASRNSRILMRKYGAEQINKMFGLNITVDFQDFKEEEGEETNNQLHLEESEDEYAEEGEEE